jgi:predicted AlkP superfamily pyrophosphatase or phosphodiesterase
MSGVTPPKGAMPPADEVMEYVLRVFDGEKADRVFMYNPDAIGSWLYAKYPNLFKSTVACTELVLPVHSELPSVTPVNFASMYTGLTPAEHGIQKYERPVLGCETVFDAFLAAGKRVAIVSAKTCTFAKIFAERTLDYYPCSSIEELHAKVAELIIRDEHDVIVFFNGDYDYAMHKMGPESPRALADLRVTNHVFAFLSDMIQSNWRHHNTLIGLATDHGCHEIDGGRGSHGLNMIEDINIVQLYKGYPKSK